MEQKLLIAGLLAFIFTLISKCLRKKGFLLAKKKMYFWTLIAVLLGAFIAYFLLDFMAKNGIQGGISFSTTAIIAAAALGIIVFYFARIKKGDEGSLKVYLSVIDWAETVYFAAFFASFVMFFFAQAFKIPSASMRNTLLEGDNLFVNKITYGARLPFAEKKFLKINDIKRGDIIVFSFPAKDKNQINCGESQYGREFVKRIVGLPGETVEVRNKQVFIDGKPLPQQPYELYIDHARTEQLMPLTQEQYQQIWENRELEKYFGLYLRDYFGPVTIPQGSYLAMGDNRDASCDSRFWGPVPEKNIKGKAWFRHWPLSRAGFIK